jgi:SAM-dependent methyltransferase
MTRVALVFVIVQQEPSIRGSESEKTMRNVLSPSISETQTVPVPRSGAYALATGEAAAYRLHVLHANYGPGTRRALLHSGVRCGMRVADLGCGVGVVTSLLAQMVGPEGHAVGIDLSAEQLAQARQHCFDNGTSNTSFHQASATATGLPSESFDLVYCRFLLLHLTEPESALREMHRLLKPGGIIVCEDGDLTSVTSEPPSALRAFAELWGRLAPIRGVDYAISRRLFHMIVAAGFDDPEITFNQPVFARGENKRLLELTVAEAGPAFVEAGLITDAELHRTLIEMRHATEDESVLAIMPRMTQVWAKKPA